MPYTELDHTADILIRVRAPTLNGLFSEAARAMFATMFADRSPGGREEAFSLCADDRDELLRDFLSELLFLSEVKGVVFTDAEVDLQGTCLSCTAHGESFDPQRHRGGTEIKGVSFSGLRIINTDEGYQVDILFDV
ncbi:MAG: archease [Methanomicrobiales archaeon]|nr:archease [Methanomicrobiales archaeon]